MAFTGFPPAAVDFFAQLEADNTKAFWTANKATWDVAARDPMLALLDQLEDEFGPATPFRPYRDVRFSADKTPYKTHIGAVAGPTKWVGCYVQLSADGLAVGGGFHAPGAAHTGRFRAAVDAPASGGDLVTIVDGLRRKGFEVRGPQSRPPHAGSPRTIRGSTCCGWPRSWSSASSGRPPGSAPRERPPRWPRRGVPADHSPTGSSSTSAPSEKPDWSSGRSSRLVEPPSPPRGQASRRGCLTVGD